MISPDSTAEAALPRVFRSGPEGEFASAASRRADELAPNHVMTRSTP